MLRTKKKSVSFLSIFALLVFIIFISGCTQAPPTAADVAKCLAASGAKLYGASSCSDCDDQKAHFGGDFKYITYIECDGVGSEECKKEGITKYPTWVFKDGQKLSGVQYLEDLAKHCDTPRITSKKEEPSVPKEESGVEESRVIPRQGGARVNAPTKSMYEGTYEGKLEYEYNPTCPHIKKTLPDGRTYLAPDGTGWIPATLMLRIKLGSIPEHDDEGNDHVYSRRDLFDVRVLNVWFDDPDFQTGSDGYKPVNNRYSELVMPWLPRDPADPAHNVIMEDGESLQLDWTGMVFSLLENPNDRTSKALSSFSLTGNFANPTGFYVSDDAKVIRSIPIPHQDYMGDEGWSAYQDTWNANIEKGSGPLSLDKQLEHWKAGCRTRFKTWSLTRISDS
ncbi:MAG: hypothetical protein Q7J54_01880 [Candidatus Woesearchaeota archaeon]|nr:hypothetical protein [Candidatus Woesearchaeota archaeon]